MLIVMGAYSLVFAPTIPLTTSLMFAHLGKLGIPPFRIFIWIPIGWALAGLGLTAWRRRAKQESDGRDCLILASVLSFAMVVCCLFLPDTPPKIVSFIDALSLLKNPQFLIFLIVSLLVTMQLQFYYLGTAPFLEAVGVQQKNVPAAMSIAQIAQMGAMAVLAAIPTLLPGLGFRWALTLGIVLWMGMYSCYVASRPCWLVVGSMALHGLAYALFINVGWVYVDKVAPGSASAQGLLSVVTFGLGMFLGTQVTGIVMDRLKDADTFRWRAIFLVPCVALLICAVVFVALFRVDAG
jgi:predicted MFS family arabinose efflux permease